MRPISKDKFSSHKITRWDRIRKRNDSKNSFSINSDVVQNFFEQNYVNEYDESVLCGKRERTKGLSPLLVMDMRHEMFRKIPRKLPLVTVGGRRTLDACIFHNLVVEDRYITNELNKFRQQLQKNIKRNMLKMKTTENAKNDVHNLDNNCLMQSLERSAKHIQDFYSAPLDALQAVDDLCESKAREIMAASKVTQNGKYENRKPVGTSKNDKEEKRTSAGSNCDCIAVKDIKCIDAQNETIKISHDTYLSKQIELQANATEFKSFSKVESPHENICESNLGMGDQLLEKAPYECRNAIATNVVIDNSYQMRCVRFDESVDVRNFNRENSSCSNTSDGIDSVVSDLAEEALFELQMESEDIFTQETKYDSVSNRPPSTTENTLESLIIKRLPNPSQVDCKQITTEDLEEESISNHEQNLIIAQLFKPRANTNHTLLRKYFLKWIHFITIEKIEREDVSSKGDRIHKINLFLDKIRKEKLRLTRNGHQCSIAQGRGDAKMRPEVPTQVARKYQNKIKIQQDVIDLQRLKLERQERIIMELKLNKLSDEAKEARQDLKNELKSIIRHGDHKFKAKAKCLQLVGNLQDENDDNMASLHGRAMLMPKCLIKMQERALERSIRHEKARQRRLQQEAEKEAQKMAAEEAKRLEDEEAKRLRIEALKEKRRLEKMAKVLKEREYQWTLEARCKADEFYRRLLLRRVGMEVFKKLIRRKRENSRKCEQFRRKIFKRTYFLSWRDYYLKLRNEKLTLADDLYEKLLKRKALQTWQLYVQKERSKFNVAVDWCDLKRTEITFKYWAQYSARMSAIEAAKLNQAKSHHVWHLKWKVLDCWQRLPQILQLERETEERRQRWRMKIWELLPDYTPNREDLP